MLLFVFCVMFIIYVQVGNMPKAALPSHPVDADRVASIISGVEKVASVFKDFSDEARDDCIAMAQMHLAEPANFMWKENRVREFFTSTPRRIVGVSPDTEATRLPFLVPVNSFFAINPSEDQPEYTFWIACVCHKCQINGEWNARLRYLTAVDGFDPKNAETEDFITTLYYEKHLDINPADLPDRMPIKDLHMPVSMSNKGKQKGVQLYAIDQRGKMREKVRDCAIRFGGPYTLYLFIIFYFKLYLFFLSLASRPPTAFLCV